MRYYAVNITDPASAAPIYLKSLGGMPLSSLLPQGSQNPIYGQTNVAALGIEFDLPVANLTNPSGGAYLRIWGIGIDDLRQSSNYNGKNIEIRGGMAKGLPLANPQQAGVLVTGTIQQAFGNWIGTEQTLDFLIGTGGPSSDSTTDDSGNFPFSWPANTPLSTAIGQTLSVGLPGVSQQISISPKLVVNHAVTGFYNSLTQFADFIQGLSQSLIGGDYDGVTIALNDNFVTVFDDADAGTDTAPPTKAIAFQDLIGQPTWLQPLLISVKTVLRADIHLGDIVSLPPTIVSVSGAALPGYGDNNPARNNVSFGGGTYLVVDVHHFGNSRGPMADAWNTTFQMTPA